MVSTGSFHLHGSSFFPRITQFILLCLCPENRGQLSLVWLALREVEWRPLPPGEMLARLRPWAVLALVVAFGQMALGG